MKNLVEIEWYRIILKYTFSFEKVKNENSWKKKLKLGQILQCWNWSGKESNRGTYAKSIIWNGFNCGKWIKLDEFKTLSIESFSCGLTSSNYEISLLLLSAPYVLKKKDEKRKRIIQKREEISRTLGIWLFKTLQHRKY